MEMWQKTPKSMFNMIALKQTAQYGNMKIEHQKNSDTTVALKQTEQYGNT